jgi:CspA family cold shock protein
MRARCLPGERFCGVLPGGSRNRWPDVEGTRARRFVLMIAGKVKWFNAAKGFGFIEGGENGDIFVHYSVIQKPGYRTLKEGEMVEYELIEGPKGLQATVVQPATA